MPSDIVRLARELGLDVDRFEADLTSPEVTNRVRDDMLDAEAMDITSVPTLFVNGRRHVGPYDARSLIQALEQSAQTPSTRESSAEESSAEEPSAPEQNQETRP